MRALFSKLLMTNEHRAWQTGYKSRFSRAACCGMNGCIQPNLPADKMRRHSKARCPPEKPANANTMKKISANKTTGNFQVDTGPNNATLSSVPVIKRFRENEIELAKHGYMDKSKQTLRTNPFRFRKLRRRAFAYSSGQCQCI